MSIAFGIPTDLSIAGSLTVGGATTLASSLTLSNTTASSLLYGNGSKAVSSVVLSSNLSLTTGTLALAADLTGVNSITATAGQNATLNGGSSGASLVLGQGAGGNATLNIANTLALKTLASTSTSGAGLAIFDAYNLTTLVGEFGYLASSANNDAAQFDIWTKKTGTAIARALRVTDTQNLLIGTTTDMSGSGGLKVAGAGIFGGELQANYTGANITFAAASSTPKSGIWANADGTLSFADYVTGTKGIKVNTVNGTLTVLGTTPSTSTTTGSATFGGGIGVAGAINAGGAVTIGGNLTLPAAAAATTRYIISAANNDGTIVFQNGVGSAAAGGSLQLSGSTHATRPGWVTVGLGSGSARKFAVSDSGMPGGTDVFTVDATGAVTIGGNLTLPAAAAATTRYIISAANNDGTIVFQNGVGSAAAGGSLQLSGSTHATRPGWVTVGLGSGSARKFAVSDSGMPGGTDVFTVDATGPATFAGAVTVGGVTILKNYTVATLPAAASYTYGEAYVSDATQAAGTSIGSAPTGGGSVVRGVYSNGSAWLLR